MCKTIDKSKARQDVGCTELLGTAMRITYCGLEGWGVVVRYNGIDPDTPVEITVKTQTGDEVTVPSAQAKPETVPARLYRAEQLKREWWGVGERDPNPFQARA